MNKLIDLISTPTYSVIVPSSGQKVLFRPFVVKEERALLMAQESNDTDAMLHTLESVVHSCIKTQLTSNLSTFDIEYLFVQIRMKSVEEFSTLVFSCNKCDEKTPIQLDLKKVEVFTPPEHSKTVSLSDNLIIEMKYPEIHELIGSKDAVRVLAGCLSKIYKGDSVEDVSDYSIEDITEFLENLQPIQYEKLEQFFNTIPETRIELNWKCPKCGHDHNQILKGLDSFF